MAVNQKNSKRRLSFSSDGSNVLNTSNYELDKMGITNMISARDDSLGLAPLDLSTSRETLHVIPGQHLLSSNSSQQLLTNVSSKDPPNSAEILDCIGCMYADAVISKIINKRFVELNILQHLHLDIDGPQSLERLASTRLSALIAVIQTVTYAGISFENITSHDKILFAELHSKCNRYTIVQLMNSLSIGWKGSSVYIFQLEPDRFSMEWHFASINMNEYVESKLSRNTKSNDSRLNYVRYSKIFAMLWNKEEGRKIAFTSKSWIADVMDIFYVFFNLIATSNDVLCGKCKMRIDAGIQHYYVK